MSGSFRNSCQLSDKGVNGMSDLADEEKAKLDGKPDSLDVGGEQETAGVENQDPRKVFIVHGRNSHARNAMFQFLRSIGLNPIEWSQAIRLTGKPSPYVGEILERAFSIAQATVVLMTPDDEARLKEQFRRQNDPPYETMLTGQARPNVLFEAGVAMGYCSSRTVLVELGAIRPFSDIGGIHIIRMDNSISKRQDLAERLGLAGCNVDISGRDWHTAGNFELDQDATPARIIGKDGASMVLIPAEEFQMGDGFGEGSPDERPVHTVHLDSFYMDIYEVTNARYKEFMDATGYKEPRWWSDPNYFSFNASDHPVMGVTWYDAKAYCEWTGKRLPTEAEWEKAARGRLVGSKYPWGDTITHDDANYYGTGGRDRWEYSTSPVGSFPPNGYGLYDMAGNVWEWCADWYDRNYYSHSPRQNPKGPDMGTERVFRGGSSYDRDTKDLRVACRNKHDPAGSLTNAGFRCVRDVSS